MTKAIFAFTSVSTQAITRAFISLLVIFSLAVLASCTTTSKIDSRSLLAKIKLSNIIVRYNVGAVYQVAKLERAFRASKPNTPTHLKPFLPTTPAGQAYLRAGIESHMKPHLQRKLTPLFTGTNPVVAEIRIAKVWVPGRLRSSLVGEDYFVDASLIINDEVTGVSIIELGPFRTTTDDALVLRGEKYPVTGISKRLSDIGGKFASTIEQMLRNKYSGPDTNF